MFFWKWITQEIAFHVANPHRSADGGRGETKSTAMSWEPGYLSGMTSGISSHSGDMMSLKSLCLACTLFRHNKAKEIQETKLSAAG